MGVSIYESHRSQTSLFKVVSGFFIPMDEKSDTTTTFRDFMHELKPFVQVLKYGFLACVLLTMISHPVGWLIIAALVVAYGHTSADETAAPA